MIKSRGLSPKEETSLLKVNPSNEYNDFNKPQKTRYAKSSLKNLIDSGFFTYSDNLLTFQGEQHFLCEVDLVYILERELKLIDCGLEILFECSFNYGRLLAQKAGTTFPEKFIMDYMSSLGWGDILVSKESSGKYIVSVFSFPWVRDYENSEFIMFRGILSGFLSEALKSSIILKLDDARIEAGTFNVQFIQK